MGYAPEEIARVRAMRREGMRLAQIAAILGVHRVTIGRMLSEQSRNRHRERSRDYRTRRKYNMTVRARTSPPSPSDLAERLAEIPPDTRSLTGRICGDPLPGRSARDRFQRI